MAIVYNTLFARIGKIVKWFNLNLTTQGTSIQGAAPNGVADDVLSQYEARRDLVTGAESTMLGWSSTVAGWNAYLKGIADKTLADLQSSLSAPNGSLTTILPLLAADMTANSQSIKPCVISAPVVTAGSGNIGNGKLIASTKTTAGIDDQRIINETVLFTCTADQYTGGTKNGETFSIVGFPKLPAPGVYGTRGNGTGPSITVSDANNIIANGGFESFTVANTPDSWVLGTGAVAGTTIKSTTTAHIGATALQFTGDGSTATVIVNQVPALTASTIYAVSVWLRKNGTVTSGSNFQAAIKGTGFTTVNLFNADPSTLTTSYVNYTAFISVPAAPPTDLRIEFDWTSANTAGAAAQVLIDDAVIIKPVAFGNVQYAMFAGSTPFQKGDTESTVTATDGAGVFSTFFGRCYSQNLPTSGSPTQADSLAV